MSRETVCQIVMLPSNGNATVGSIFKYIKQTPLHMDDLDPQVGKLLLNKNSAVTKTNEYFELQHIYMISPDEEIKEGDWYYNTWGGTKEIFKCSSKQEEAELKNIHSCKSTSKKIIATTDQTLGIDLFSESTVKKYINDYNNSKEYSTIILTGHDKEV